jgi:hypothetical protein
MHRRLHGMPEARNGPWRVLDRSHRCPGAILLLTRDQGPPASMMMWFNVATGGPFDYAQGRSPRAGRRMRSTALRPANSLPCRFYKGRDTASFMMVDRSRLARQEGTFPAGPTFPYRMQMGKNPATSSELRLQLGRQER